MVQDNVTRRLAIVVVPVVAVIVVHSIIESIMDHFDDLPCFLQVPPTEPVFKSMVRLLGQGKMAFSEFARRFPDVKQVFLRPFFDFESLGLGQCTIQLRHEVELGIGQDIDIDACAKAHWENRAALTRKRMHALVQVAFAQDHLGKL